MPEPQSKIKISKEDYNQLALVGAMAKSGQISPNDAFQVVSTLMERNTPEAIKRRKALEQQELVGVRNQNRQALMQEAEMQKMLGNEEGYRAIMMQLLPPDKQKKLKEMAGSASRKERLAGLMSGWKNNKLGDKLGGAYRGYKNPLQEQGIYFKDKGQGNNFLEDYFGAGTDLLKARFGNDNIWGASPADIGLSDLYSTSSGTGNYSIPSTGGLDTNQYLLSEEYYR
jgi:hypothetical protein